MAAARQALSDVSLTPSEAARAGLKVNLDGIRRTALELLSYPDISFARLRDIWPEALGRIAPALVEQVEIDALYRGYLSRQEADIVSFRKDEALRLPADLDYDTVGGLSTEVREKLKAGRPATLGAASRLAGVTPAALSALLAHVRRAQRLSAYSRGLLAG